ncbi:hypothetical protein H5398_07725 [Tessaracoccus sp. MC1679]|uniref:hypothetical protein n=1 Tax=Tessaracoccus sp. MC1679 TaxID=2760313 RepID=UPI0016015CF4|nr:hypothetical protein [Tessaracoccus sp. MC1679]MBB1515857.1 hypothetical protein [Tessaracoccus sp. MC1679]
MSFPDDPDTPDDFDEPHDEGPSFDPTAMSLPDPPRPINWNLLSADDAEVEWLELNAWVNWLRRTYGLPASVIPPYWHHHPELVWELSALHLHWLGAYDPEQNGSAPIGWHRDFADARERLREWVAASGSRLDRDRPTRQTLWPGEEPDPDYPATGEEEVITDRDRDFVQFVIADVNRRQAVEDAFHARHDSTDDDGSG